MKLSLNKLKIKSEDIRKIIWSLEGHAFSLILFFVFIDVLFGGYILYKYVILAEREKPVAMEGVVKFNDNAYQNLLIELQARQQGESSSPVKETKIANPASSYCVKQGGSLVIKTKEDGGQYGLCFFDDNRACEEWAMMRGECPIGGVKTTGFDTIAQSFCAWSGGKTFAVENAVCTFDDGSTCLADDFYSGTCQKGENN